MSTEDVHTTLHRLASLLADGDAVAALMGLDALEAERSAPPELLLLKGLTLRKMLSLRLARSYLERYLSISPSDQVALSALAWTNEVLKRPIGSELWERFHVASLVPLREYLTRDVADGDEERILVRGAVTIPPHNFVLTSDGSIIEETCRNLDIAQIVGDLFFMGDTPAPLGGTTEYGTLAKGCPAIVHERLDLSGVDALPPSHQPRRALGQQADIPSDAHRRWQPVIDSQLAPFAPGGFSFSELDETFREVIESIRISVKGNRIVAATRSDPIVRTLRVHGYIALIADTLERFTVPDMDVIISTVDEPISSLHALYLDRPVFGFCGTRSHRTLLLPFARFGRDEVNLSLDGRLDASASWGAILPEIDRINAESPWDAKEPSVFFAGHSASSQDVRLAYGALALQHAPLLKCLLTRSMDPSGSLDNSRFAPLVGDPVPMTTFPKYRYLLHLDGVTSSERLRYLLAFNSCVIKHQSPFFEFYHPLLRAGEHYIEVQRDLTDLVTTVEDLESRSDYARAVADGGVRFAREVLSYDSVLSYVALLLRAYRQLFSR